MVAINDNEATNMNSSAGSIYILMNDDFVFEAPCSEVEYRVAIASLGSIECEVRKFGPNLVPFSRTEMRAPHGMVTLSFNAGKSIISVYHGDIKRIYWESNI